MKKKFQSQKSFTLIEILTVVFLSVIIVAAGYYLYSMSYQSFKKSSASAEVTQNARIALERMTRDIRQAVEIVTVLPETPDSPVSELKFQDGHNLWPGGGGKIQYITYSLSDNNLHRKISHYAFYDVQDDWVLWSTIRGSGSHHEHPTEFFNPSDDVIKAEKITALHFWGENVININLTASDGPNTYHFETKVLGRNVQ